MLKFIIKVYFILSFSLLFSQEIKKDSTLATPPDTNHQKFALKPLNLRIGFDIGNYIYAKTEDLNRINIYFDSNIYSNYFVNIELGKEEYLFNNQLINMSTTGNYAMFGIDYNLYDNWPGMDNQIMLGLHYGQASFSNTLKSYIINQPGSPYPASSIIVNNEFPNLRAKWLEVQSNIQVEIVKNIYLGYNISFKYLLSKKRYEDFELTYVPGFRKVNSTSNFGFGMQYFISYRFKIKKAPK